MKKAKIIWILTDNRVGTNSQSTGLAESLAKLGNYTIVTKNVTYNSLIKFPNFIRRSSLLGINKSKSDSLNFSDTSNAKDEQPDVIISAGRRLAPVALYVKRKSKNQVFAVHITNPHLPFRNFDLVIMPKHDGFKKDSKNIITTIGSINKIKKEKIEEEGRKWKKKLEKYKSPKVALMLGGDTKSTKFSPKSFARLGRATSRITNNMKGSLLVTTSRRTSFECVSSIKQNISVKNYFYDWTEENKKAKTENPYFAYMDLADFVVATGDSMSMLSEVCSTGKPLYICYSEKEIPKKHFRFCENLVNLGYAKKLDLLATEKFEKYKYKPLNETERVAKIVHKHIDTINKGK